jgi:hypothetical protein
VIHFRGCCAEMGVLARLAASYELVWIVQSRFFLVPPFEARPSKLDA